MPNSLFLAFDYTTADVVSPIPHSPPPAYSAAATACANGSPQAGPTQRHWRKITHLAALPYLGGTVGCGQKGRAVGAMQDARA